jgi:hypothetical protein
MASNGTIASSPSCPAAMKATSNGVFQGDNPLDFALPLAILQICIVVALTRILAFLLRPLRQPRVIAEIIVSSFLSSFFFVLCLYIHIYIFTFIRAASLLSIIINKDLDTYHDELSSSCTLSLSLNICCFDFPATFAS